MLGDRGQRGGAVVGGHRLEAVEAQRRGHQVGHVVLVVDHQHPALGGAATVDAGHAVPLRAGPAPAAPILGRRPELRWILCVAAVRQVDTNLVATIGSLRPLPRPSGSAHDRRRPPRSASLTSPIVSSPKWNTLAASTASAPASTAGAKSVEPRRRRRSRSPGRRPPRAPRAISSQVEAVLRAVGVHRVQQDLARAELGRPRGPLDRVDAGAAAAAVRRHLEAGRRPAARPAGARRPTAPAPARRTARRSRRSAPAGRSPRC